MISKKDFKAQVARYLEQTKGLRFYLRRAGLYGGWCALIVAGVCLFCFILYALGIIDSNTFFLIFMIIFILIGLIGGVLGMLGLLINLALQHRKMSSRVFLAYSNIFSLLSIQIPHERLDIPADLIHLYRDQNTFCKNILLPSYSFCTNKIYWMNFCTQTETKDFYNASYIYVDTRLPISGQVIAVPSIPDDDKANPAGYYPVHYKGKLFDALKFYATNPKQTLKFLSPDFEEKLEIFLDSAFLTPNGIGTNYLYLKFDSNGINILIPDGPFAFDITIDREYNLSANRIRRTEWLFTDYGSLDTLYKTAKHIHALDHEVF